MNIILCVDGNGKFVPFSTLLVRPKTLDFVFKFLQDSTLLCNKQDAKFFKLAPYAKIIVKDENYEQKLPDFLTPQPHLLQKETVATLEELPKIICKLNPNRTFAVGSLAEEILNTTHLATKIFLVNLSTKDALSATQNILPSTYKKIKTHEFIFDEPNLDYVSEYILKINQ